MTLKVGLVGTGHWAEEAHGAGLVGHPDCEFVGVWGRNPDKAEAVGQRLGVMPYADIDALFAAVDAVSMAVPPDVQADLAIRAASAGCHLLLEKPMALSLAAADAVVDAVEQHGVAALVFFTSRFSPAVESWLDDVRRKDDWHGGRAVWFGSIFDPGNPFGASPWRQREGALWDVGPHALSVALPVLGPVDDLIAARGLGDTTHVVARHISGASSTLALSLTVPPAATMKEFMVYGPDGISTMPYEGIDAVSAFRRAFGQLSELAGGAGADGAAPRHPCDARFGRDVVAVLERIQRYVDG